jgi:fructose-bisphosphate aldolase class II
MEALHLGFSSVMYDCSTDSYEDNIKRVAEMTRIAHSFGATVEGELGHVGDNEGSEEGDSHLSDPSKFYTDPKMAKDFTDRTNIDALAIAIGTAHGTYKTTPKLDIERLKEIRATIPTPLVLHGGSGLSNDDFKNCIEGGITKVRKVFLPCSLQ